MAGDGKLVGIGYKKRFELAVQLSDGSGILTAYRVIATGDSWREIKCLWNELLAVAQDVDSELYAMRIHDRALDKMVRTWNYE